MTRHAETRFVPYTADLMYAVVSDVEHYPEFLPWVVHLRVLSRALDGPRETVMAEMSVGYMGLHERYTSRVSLDPARRCIDVVQTAGPFRALENHWGFTPEDTGCAIEFAIVFELRNRLLDAVAGAAFGRALLQMADAFEERARLFTQKGRIP